MAVNSQRSRGWNLQRALKFIIDQHKSAQDANRYGFTRRDRVFAEVLLSYVVFTQAHNVQKDAFYLHTKGKGVICVK